MRTVQPPNNELKLIRIINYTACCTLLKLRKWNTNALIATGN